MSDPISAALLCLALNVYHESRGEPRSGQLAVAHVTLNRAKASDEHVCVTVYKPAQFSWTLSKAKLTFVPRDNDKVWSNCLSIARHAKRSKDTTGGATFFHTTTVDPYWAASVQKVAHIGNHIFYKRTRST